MVDLDPPAEITRPKVTILPVEEVPGIPLPTPTPTPRRTKLHTPLWAYALVFAVGFAIVYFSTREVAEE